MGTHAVIANIRKRLANSHNSQENLSTIMSNVSLSSYLPPEKGLTVAAFKVATITPSAIEITDKIARLFNGELSVVAGSLKVLEKTKYYTSVSAYLVRNTVTRALVNGIPRGFISLSKNIFMEERDSATWKLQTTDEGKQILVRDNIVETDADMEKLLSSLSSVGHQYSNDAKRLQLNASTLKNEVEEGVLIAFVAPSKNTQLGFIVSIDGQGYMGVVNTKYHTIASSAVMHSWDVDQYQANLTLPKLEIFANMSNDINFKIDYYKKVYGYNQEFLQKWLDKITSNGML